MFSDLVRLHQARVLQTVCASFAGWMDGEGGGHNIEGVVFTVTA